MNHPKKKKNKNPLLPNDQQVDERNLIDLEDAASFSFEDRAHIYWKENKGFLISCITALLLIIVAYQSMRIVKENIEAGLQAEYAKADAENTLAEFARSHVDESLGGFAALKVADEAYTDKDYEIAIELYTLAGSALEEPLLAGRAKLGHAFALYNHGKTGEGLAQLNAITSDISLAESIRAEAAYHLAVEAHTAGRDSEFSSYADQVNNSKFASQWQENLQSLSGVRP